MIREIQKNRMQNEWISVTEMLETLQVICPWRTSFVEGICFWRSDGDKKQSFGGIAKTIVKLKRGSSRTFDPSKFDLNFMKCFFHYWGRCVLPTFHILERRYLEVKKIRRIIYSFFHMFSPSHVGVFSQMGTLATWGRCFNIQPLLQALMVNLYQV